MTRFALATLDIQGVQVPAIEIGDSFYPLGHARTFGYAGLWTDIKGLLTDWSFAFTALQTFADACASGAIPRELSIPAAQARPSLAIQYPNKLLAIGINYTAHGPEMGHKEAEVEKPPYPVMFVKPPTTCLCGPGKVFLPSLTEMFDWEAELAIVIGRRMRRVRGPKALEGIAGYTVGVDFTCRDLSRRPDFRFGMDFLMGKGQDQMNPIGPVIVPSGFVPDPHKLQITLSINGVQKQNFSTAGMLYSIQEQIEALSDVVTLEPGDVIMTGTSAGVGMKRGPGVVPGPFLKPGDRVETAITGIGVLRSEITLEPPPDNTWLPLGVK